MREVVKIIGKYLRGIFIALLFFAFAFSYSQTDIGGWNTSKLRKSNKTIKQINGRNNRTDILNKAIIYKLQNPDSLVGVHFIETIDIKLTELVLIDTIKISRRIDVDRLPVRAFRDMVIDGYYYVLFRDEGMVKFITDSLPRDKIEYIFERTKKFGKSSYININTPPGLGTLKGVEIE